MRERLVWLASLTVDNGEVVVSVSMTGIELQNITEEFGCDRRVGLLRGPFVPPLMLFGCHPTSLTLNPLGCSESLHPRDDLLTIVIVGRRRLLGQSFLDDWWSLSQRSPVG